jgi:tRNA (cmo5U34)-methyltransferase
MSESAWGEQDSRHFLDLGRIYTPRRDDLRDAFLDLIPAEPGDKFLSVELASGAGWLSAAILDRFPLSRIVALDGSETMRAETARGLAGYPGRWEVRPFQLEDQSWRVALPDDARAIVSSLVIHHLMGPDKRQLFADLLPKIEPGGVLLVADLMEPVNRWTRQHYGRAWNQEVERQSTEIGGGPEAYQQFLADEWNYYDFPVTEVDFPSSTLEHGDWMRDAGFEAVDIPWSQAGHALICGYRPG